MSLDSGCHKSEYKIISEYLFTSFHSIKRLARPQMLLELKKTSNEISSFLCIHTIFAYIQLISMRNRVLHNIFAILSRNIWDSLFSVINGKSGVKNSVLLFLSWQRVFLMTVICHVAFCSVATIGAVMFDRCNLSNLWSQKIFLTLFSMNKGYVMAWPWVKNGIIS